VFLPGKTFGQALLEYLRKSGPYFVAAQALKMLCFRTGCVVNRILKRDNERSHFYSYKEVANAKKVKIYSSVDINAEESQQLLKSMSPDLIVILLFAQILKDSTIGIAPLGVVNFHPSLLPGYRGLLPIFWGLANNEKQLGVTLHFVDEGIDTGPVIARLAVEVNGNDTEHSIYARISVLTSQLLSDLIKRLKRGELKSGYETKEKSGSYFSLPSREAVKRYRHSGKKFFTLTQLFIPFEEL
jgi:methionyl-tRNA formyltransferase